MSPMSYNTLLFCYPGLSQAHGSLCHFLAHMLELWSGFRLKKESFATPVRSLTRVKDTHPIFCLLNDLRLLLVTPSSYHKIGLMKDRKESREQ